LAPFRPKPKSGVIYSTKMPHLWCFSLSVLCISFVTFAVKKQSSTVLANRHFSDWHLSGQNLKAV